MPLLTRDIIAIGTSAGGLEALTELVKGLSANLPATVFVVQHIPPAYKQALPEILTKSGPLKATLARAGEKFERAHIYVAKADFHLLFKNAQTFLGNGPKENFVRPAIDPFFRSAAVNFGPRVTGVLLSGTLDDGTAGLLDIKQQGGITVIQDPEEAKFPEMPQSALEAMKVDYIVGVSDMGKLFNEISRQKVKVMKRAPVEMRIEAGIAWAGGGRKDIKKMGKLSSFTCPDCKGPLWEMNRGNYLRYRCDIGHAYSKKTVCTLKDDELENSLWAGVRVLEERVLLLERMAAYEKAKKRFNAAKIYEKKAEKLRNAALTMRRFLVMEFRQCAIS